MEFPVLWFVPTASCPFTSHREEALPQSLLGTLLKYYTCGLTAAEKRPTTCCKSSFIAFTFKNNLPWTSSHRPSVPLLYGTILCTSQSLADVRFHPACIFLSRNPKSPINLLKKVAKGMFSVFNFEITVVSTTWLRWEYPYGSLIRWWNSNIMSWKLFEPDLQV